MSARTILGAYPAEHLSTDGTDSAEWYERGLTLRKAGLFRMAITQLEKAASDPLYELKAYAQIGICHKALRQYDQAANAFRNALKAPAASTNETVQVLYALGRTLETGSRLTEALDMYRWLRREDPQFRDVTDRIEYLSNRRSLLEQQGTQRPHPRAGYSSAWQALLRNRK